MKLVLLAVAVVVGVGWFHLHAEKVAAEQTEFGLIASTLAGRTVHVHCQSAIGAAVDVNNEAGSVQFDANGVPTDHTDLDHDVCNGLARFKHDVTSTAFACVLQDAVCPRSVFEDVQAVHTLAHESAHLAGQESEAAAECRALQTTAYVASRLGATPGAANATAVYAYRHLYPNLPDEYRTGGCTP